MATLTPATSAATNSPHSTQPFADIIARPSASTDRFCA